MKNKLALILVGTALVVTSTVLKVSAQSASSLSLQSVATGFCLDSDKKYVGPEAPPNQGTVYTKPCKSNNPYQKWNPSKSGSGVILTHPKTGLCLTNFKGRTIEKDSILVTSGCDDNKNQMWFFTSNRTPNDNRSDGQWKNVETGLCLDSNNNGEAYTLGCSGQHTGQNWGTR